jgi:hypothetical protein
VTKTQTIAAVSSLLLVLGLIGAFYGTRTSHEIVVAPVHGSQR